jgi:hypothetical protein
VSSRRWSSKASISARPSSDGYAWTGSGTPMWRTSTA